MKRFIFVFAIALLVAAAPALAQSSGNFSATFSRATCTMDNATGALDGGIDLAGFPWTTTIKVPNGSGTAAIIRPSFVTGLLTKTRLDSGETEATASAGLRVCVDLDQGLVNGSADPVCIMFDKRFQQFKSNLFTTLLADCDLAAEGIQPCNLELTISTLGARSYDFIAHEIPGGIRTVTVDVDLVDLNTTGGDAAACLGPGAITVVQTKVHHSGEIVDLTR